MVSLTHITHLALNARKSPAVSHGLAYPALLFDYAGLSALTSGFRGHPAGQCLAWSHTEMDPSCQPGQALHSNWRANIPYR